MALDPLSLGVGIASVGAQYYMDKQNQRRQDQNNADNRQFQWDMYWRQREDALSDWKSNNDYNSPLQQMQRLKEAGLNPHLVYGKGADNTASMARSSQGGQGNKIAPQTKFDPQQSLNHLMQQQVTSAQTDNLYANTKLQQQNAILAAANTAKVLQDTGRGKYDWDLAKELRSDVIMRAKLENENIMADIDLKDTQNTALEQQMDIALKDLDMRKLLNAPNVVRAWADATQAQLKNAQNPQEVAILEAQLALLNQNVDNAKLENEIRSYANGMLKDTGVDVTKGNTATTIIATMMAKLFKLFGR